MRYYEKADFAKMTKPLIGLNDKDIEILFLSVSQDGKVDVNSFAPQAYRAVRAILLDKLKHSIIDYQNETGITFWGVFEKFDLKWTAFLPVPQFEKLLDEYWVNLNETMKWILLLLLDQTGSKTISYHYLVKIFDLDTLD